MRKDSGEIASLVVAWFLIVLVLLPIVVGHVLGYVLMVYHFIGAIPDQVTQFLITYIY